MDFSPRQLDAIHEGYKVLTAPPDARQSGEKTIPHSRRKRPGT